MLKKIATLAVSFFCEVIASPGRKKSKSHDHRSVVASYLFRKSIVVFFLLSILTAPLLLGQDFSRDQHKVDSLKPLIEKYTGEKQWECLKAITFAYINLSRLEDALSTAQQMQFAADALNDTFKIVKSGRVAGQVLRGLERLEESNALFVKYRLVAKRNKLWREYKVILNSLGAGYTMLGQYDKALALHFENLSVEAEDDIVEPYVSYHNIGLVYYKLKDYDKAIYYYKRALGLKVDVYDLARLYSNVSLCFSYKRDLVHAKKYLDLALLTCDKSKCTDSELIEVYYSQGMMFFQSKKFSDAEKYFKRSYELALTINNKRFQLENIVELTRIYIANNNLELAEYYLAKGELINSQLSYNLLSVEIFGRFAELYRKTNNYKQESLYQSKYIQLKDSIFGEELTQKLMVVQAEYEQRENEAKLASQNKVLALKEQALHRQYGLTALGALAVLLLITLVMVLYRSSRQKKKINAILEEKVQQRSQQLETNFKTIEKAYHERRSFIQETSEKIHAPLATLKDLCERATKEAESEDERQYTEQLNKTTETLEKAVSALASNPYSVDEK